jgi:hypothetical protein
MNSIYVLYETTGEYEYIVLFSKSYDCVCWEMEKRILQQIDTWLYDFPVKSYKIRRRWY